MFKEVIEAKTQKLDEYKRLLGMKQLPRELKTIEEMIEELMNEILHFEQFNRVVQTE